MAQIPMLWFDVCFHYGGASNAVGDISKWSNHQTFKLRIKRGAFSGAHELWVSNNKKFIRLKRRVVSWGWRDRGLTQNSIKWPEYVMSEDGKTFGAVGWASNKEVTEIYRETGLVEIHWWDIQAGGGYGKERPNSFWTAAQVFKHKIPDNTSKRISHGR